MCFGDSRVAERAEWMVERIAATGSLVLRRIGEERSGEIAAQRFLSSRYASPDRIVRMLADRTAASCAGRRILAVQDTTEINFAGRVGKRRGFGPGGNGEAPGFFIHPVIAVDIASEAVLGLVDAQIWTRSSKAQAGRRQRVFAEKESGRWGAGCKAAAEALHEALSVTMVGDAESDIYSLFVEKPEGIDLIVRVAQNRKLAEGGYLFDALEGAEPLCRNRVVVAPRGPGDKGRIAQVELRARTVRVARPKNGLVAELPKSLELTLVEAREVDAPEGEKPLHWRLLTTHKVSNAEQANEVVQLYRLRWRIEQLFRSLKSDGLQIEDSQIIDAERMFNLAAVGLGGAIRIIQLVDARDGSSRPISDVVEEACAPALQRISQKLEGRTDRQKNPHPKDSLAFVAWIAARLGGWNCYYKPPGPKTMRIGWNRLAAMLEGYAVAMQGKDP
jgi:Transposase DDE domain